MSSLDLAIAEAERSPLVQAAKARLEADRKKNPALSADEFRKFVAPGWSGLAGYGWYTEYWKQFWKTLNALPVQQREAYLAYDRLLNAKSKQDHAGSDFGLNLIKGVIGGIAGLGVAQAFSASSAISSAGNVAKGIDFATVAAPGVNLADPLIGTGIKLTGSTVLDGAVSSSVLSGFSLTDLTKAGSTVFKTASAVNTLAGGGGGSGASGPASTGGSFNLNLTGLDMPSTDANSPIGAKTNSGTTPPVNLTSGGGGGSVLPLLAIAALGFFLWKAKK